jgi:hypothetical protein
MHLSGFRLRLRSPSEAISSRRVAENHREVLDARNGTSCGATLPGIGNFEVDSNGVPKRRRSPEQGPTHVVSVSVIAIEQRGRAIAGHVRRAYGQNIRFWVQAFVAVHT